MPVFKRALKPAATAAMKYKNSHKLNLYWEAVISAFEQRYFILIQILAWILLQPSYYKLDN